MIRYEHVYIPRKALRGAFHSIRRPNQIYYALTISPPNLSKDIPQRALRVGGAGFARESEEGDDDQIGECPHEQHRRPGFV